MVIIGFMIAVLTIVFVLVLSIMGGYFVSVVFDGKLRTIRHRRIAKKWLKEQRKER
jgi:uncharacterized membrane protein